VPRVSKAGRKGKNWLAEWKGSQIALLAVIPAKAGIQGVKRILDSRLSILRSSPTAEDGRGSDDLIGPPANLFTSGGARFWISIYL